MLLRNETDEAVSSMVHLEIPSLGLGISESTGSKGTGSIGAHAMKQTRLSPRPFHLWTRRFQTILIVVVVVTEIPNLEIHPTV